MYIHAYVYLYVYMYIYIYIIYTLYTHIYISLLTSKIEHIFIYLLTIYMYYWKSICLGPLLIFNFFKDSIYLLLERGKGKERNINSLPLAHPQLGTCSSIQTCVLTGNQTSDLFSDWCSIH